MFNKLSSANGRGLQTALFLFASRGKEILPFLNEKLLSVRRVRKKGSLIYILPLGK